MAHGWIGGPPGDTAADRAERAPSLVVTAAHSAFGAVRRLQVRVGEVTVLLHSAPPDGWARDAVVDELDIAAHLAAHLDLAGRDDETAPTAAAAPDGTTTAGGGSASGGLAAPDGAATSGGAAVAGGWSGTLPAARYAALRRADPADADALAGAAGCPVELVRALADPVALSRVEVVRRDGAARGTGPSTVGTDELAWVDGGDDGLWTVRPGEPDEVLVGRGTPAGVVTELAGLVRAAEGC